MEETPTMSVHQIKKGLDLPISGDPEQQNEISRKSRHVALMADDYVGMRPTMQVGVGDTVKRGQLLFDDKKMPGVRYTAPGAGKVTAVNRGARRAFQSVVIELSSAEAVGKPMDEELLAFENYSGKAVADLSRDAIRDLLIESGLWTALRQRPYGRVAHPDATPRSIFVTAMDTSPLAPKMDVVVKGYEEEFRSGLRVVAKLTEGPVFLCKAPGADIPTADDVSSLRVEEFAGPHPAGNVGLHMHTLDPVGRERISWYLNAQDVIAVGVLFATGKLHVDQVVALAGPTVQRPRLLRARWGAAIDDIVDGELEDVENRIISGSVLSGRTAMGEALGYLGRFDSQISALAEGREREFFGWAMPGANIFSTIPAFLSHFLPPKKHKFTTTTNGSNRAIVPIGMYERVMPFDTQPTYLLRSLAVGDIEGAEALGALELGEEDVALCSFVDPGKADFAGNLRDVLTQIEKEG